MLQLSSGQRPPLTDSEQARGPFRARAAGIGRGCLSQGALLTLVAIATLDLSSQRPGRRGQRVTCSGDGAFVLLSRRRQIASRRPPR